MTAVIALLAAGSLTVGSITFALINRLDVDPETFCPLDGDYPRTAILIDASDTLSERQGEEAVASIRDLFEGELEQHEWVGIYVVSEDETVLTKPSAFICNPGGRDSANPLYQNPTEFERRYEEFFYRLETEISGVVGAPAQESSPILEMVTAVAESDEFSRRPNRLLIVSDMLHNTREYSQFRESLDFGEWRDRFRGQDYLGPSLLRGIDVQVVYVKRESYAGLQTRRHVKFWEDYFRSVGGSLTRVTPI